MRLTRKLTTSLGKQKEDQEGGWDSTREHSSLTSWDIFDEASNDETVWS